jgi:hypothetical protein
MEKAKVNASVKYKPEWFCGVLPVTYFLLTYFSYVIIICHLIVEKSAA